MLFCNGALSVHAQDAQFWAPAVVPHKDHPSGTAWAIPFQVSISPSTDVQSVTLTIFDPTDPGYCHAVSSSGSVVFGQWNGKLSNGVTSRYCKASNVFMSAVATMNYGSPKNFTHRAIAIGIRYGTGGDWVGENAELDAGYGYSANLLYNPPGIPIPAHTTAWTAPLAFQSGLLDSYTVKNVTYFTSKAKYNPEHLLQPSQLTEDVIQFVHATGSMCSVTGTDLENRTISVQVNMGADTFSSTFDLKLVVNYRYSNDEIYNDHAMITFYYVPYEHHTCFNDTATKEVKIIPYGGGTPQTAYLSDGYDTAVPSSFWYDVSVQGTGKHHRLRSQPGTKDSGDERDILLPYPQIMYLKYRYREPSTNIYVYEEVDSVTGGYQMQELYHQDAAIFSWGTSQSNPPKYQGSVYNYNSIYNVGMLGYALSAYRSLSTEPDLARGPLPGTGPITTHATTKDSGPFHNDLDVVFFDRRHLDIFIEPDDHERGIDPINVHQKYKAFYSKVWK